jgi:iron(III) transport system substrate-binding protein
MPSPLYSGAATIHIGTVIQQKAFGWNYYDQLARLGAVAGQGNGTVVEAVARGEKAYGIIIEYMAFNAKAKGSPVDFVFPKEGVSIITQPVAILKTAKNLEAAKAFVDWQLSEKAQVQSVGQGYYPAIPALTPPKGYPRLDAVKVMDSDPALILKQDADIKKRFADLFGG